MSRKRLKVLIQVRIQHNIFLKMFLTYKRIWSHATQSETWPATKTNPSQAFPKTCCWLGKWDEFDSSIISAVRLTRAITTMFHNHFSSEKILCEMRKKHLLLFFNKAMERLLDQSQVSFQVFINVTIHWMQHRYFVPNKNNPSN
jgi:hypothetical protein